MFLQSIFALLLSPIAKIVNAINETVRDCIVFFCCLGLTGYFLVYYNPLFRIRYRLTFDHFVCSIILFFLIIFSIKGELKRVKWNHLIAYLFFFSGFGILLISFLHPVGSGYRAFAMMMIFGFPCMYYVWGNRGDYDSLFNKIALATVLSGLTHYIYNVYLSFHGRLEIVLGRVKGGFYDSNMFSMLGMVMVCSALYMVLVKKNSRAWFATSCVGLGSGISIVIMGASRLSILVIVAGIFAYLIYSIKTGQLICRENRARSIVRLELMILSVVVFIIIANCLFLINSSAVKRNNVVSMIIAHQDIVYIVAQQFDQDVQLTETDDNVLPSEESPIDVTERFNLEGGDVNTYTTGRLGIWKGYTQFLNLTGNDFSKADWGALTNGTVKHAHNNFLEIAYRCGVPVACLHVLLELCSGIICIIWLFGKKYKEPYYLFSIEFMICYAVESLFDIATLPFERQAPFYFYMAMIPIFNYGLEQNKMSIKTEKHLKQQQ